MTARLPGWTLALLALCLAAPAQAGDGRRRGNLTVQASLETTDAGEALAFRGTFTGLENKKFKATITLRSGLSAKVLDEKDCEAPQGKFQGQFGPYERPLWPQTYVLHFRATAAPGKISETGKAEGVLNLNEVPPSLDREVEVDVRVTKRLAEQREEQAGRFRDALVLLRGLFLSVERQVPSLKARYEKDAPAATKAYEAWWKKWGTDQTSLAQSFNDKSYLNYWGNPFAPEYEALAGATDRLRKYAERVVVNIAGEEKFDPRDRGKSWDELEKAGHIPSRILREQFLYCLGSAYETTELPNPNAALVAAALSELADAFLSLHAAAHGEGLSPDGARMKKYRAFREKVGTLEEELHCFFRNRKQLLAGEQRIQEQVALLDQFKVRLDELEKLLADQKTGKASTEKVAGAELSLALDLVRGTVVVAVPELKKAYEGAWGTWQSIIESYRQTAGFVGVDPPDPSDVRKGFDPRVEKADALLADAHRFLTEFGETAPGVPPVMDVVRAAEELSTRLRALLKSCESMDREDDEEKRKGMANKAEKKASDIAEALTKLNTSVEEVFARAK